MKEIVVISGKGGTGKTSLLASFAILAENAILADCDVDAADLHLLLKPEIVEKHEFWSGHEAVIRPDLCSACGACVNLCRFDAVRPVKGPEGVSSYEVDPVACEGCGVCVRFCPRHAVEFPERRCGAWMISRTRAGPMVHAQLGIAAENSGKLVSTVRSEARRLAEKTRRGMILADGPPGLGCPVIAALTGASAAVVVTEPTVSGAHDLERVLELTRHFHVPAFVCVNKWDINSPMTEDIERLAGASGAAVPGRIRYDEGVTRAQMEEKAVVETDAASAEDIRKIWNNLKAMF